MKSETRQIGDHRYTVTMLPLSQWQQLRDAVWPTLIGVLPDLLDRDESPSAEELADAVRSASIMLPLQPESYRAALKILHECSTVEGKTGYLSTIAEIWWAETGYAELGEWLAFALEVQLVPFLSGAPLASLRRMAQGRQSASQITSIGMSGGSSVGGMAH